MKIFKKILLLLAALLFAWIIFAQFGMRHRFSEKKANKVFSEAGVAFTSENITADKFLLHYVKTGSDTLPTLFFVHGSPGSWMKFEQYMRDKELLLKYRMLAVDRPGFGYSHFGCVKSLDDQSKIISALLEKISNGKPVYAVGRSYGGPMILKLAIDNPGYFSGLVLLAAAVDPDAENPEKWRPVLFKTPLNYLVPGAWRPSNKELWYLKKELKELTAGLSGIKCPVYIMHGDKDGLVPVSNAGYTKKMLVNAESVSVKIIPGANHFISDNQYDMVKEVLMKLY